jgi:hypothetical protein
MRTEGNRQRATEAGRSSEPKTGGSSQVQNLRPPASIPYFEAIGSQAIEPDEAWLDQAETQAEIWSEWESEEGS